ncbi:hypothetical protein CC78DRAFT_606095 [Lojkania enalia]|uniref:Uncharacterized protein n=1 Tax=Lojkania enalia TaxID=147567 RepID=A0A9P4K777_9PLEO|nr:hypothetical protein CC78DRAFT_606095 [Didymosphaeria enalia]
MSKQPYTYDPIRGNEKPARASTAAISHSSTRDVNRNREHGRLFWTEISWRFAGAFVFSVIIVAILYRFSQMGNLSRWEKRWFNVLTILFSSLVSLMLGSLLGLLGNMLRWPLLARKAHEPMDVDLILGMSNPTGAFRLICYHTMHWKWRATTVVVTLYLLVNIIGRLSVASFGLTFDLNEIPGVEYPVIITDWSTDAWFNKSVAGGYTRLDYQMNDYAAIGLSTVPTPFNSTVPSTFNLTNAGGRGLDRKVEGDKVTYSYFLREYRGAEEKASADKVLHSSSKCIGRNLWGSDVYEKGRIVGNITPLDYSELSNPPSAYYLGYTEKLVRNATYFECTTCLTDQKNKPGLGSDVLFGLPSVNASMTAGLLLELGAFERVYEDYARGNGTSFSVRQYPGMNKNLHFMNDRDNAVHSGVEENAPRTSVPLEAELYAAHVAARLPILAIIGADSQLPRVTREKGASERPFVNTVLEVRWKRTVAVLASILAGQVIAIAVVKFMCRRVFIRDHDSYLSLARLMKTVMEKKVVGRSTDSGKDLAQFLKDEGVIMRYGTRSIEDGYYEVDLWDGERPLNGEFRSGRYN